MEDARCIVDVPRQSCCGQPAFNSGDRATTREIAAQVIDAFEPFDYVVAPSGSCAGMLKVHYPELFRGDPNWQPRADAFAAKTYELVAFLVDVCGVTAGRGAARWTATYHDSCSGLARARRARAAAGAAAHRRRPAGSPRCATPMLLRLRRHVLREISRHLRRHRRQEGGRHRGHRRRPAARRRSRLSHEHGRQAAARGRAIEVRHVAEVLAGMTAEPAIGLPRTAPRQAASRQAAGPARREVRPMGEADDAARIATSPRFKDNAKAALADPDLQNALKFVEVNFIAPAARGGGRACPNSRRCATSARDIKDHTLAHLDLYLEAYEERLTAQGGHLHYAVTAEDARQIILDICRKLGARTVTKGKSMVAEEIGLNDYLEGNGVTPVETDLGEYIIQLRHELPSHIIAPAVHLTKAQVEDDFRRVHTHLAPDRNLAEPTSLLAEARAVLREKFLAADVGITGANFLVAETGTSVIVTNEGNGDLTQTLPKAHIVLASLEKLVPTLEDLAQLLRVLARSATGQEMSVYTTLSTGPRRADDPDGPGEYHVVLLDNGRSSMIGGEFRDMLRCIRCGACMNHCPVYHAVGGHAYGWVYPGPMGAVLTPSLIGIDKAGHLPNASTFCGRCEEVCPVRIPLPRMMRSWREREFERHLSPATVRGGLALWAFFAKRPRLYGFAAADGGAAPRTGRARRAGGSRGCRSPPAGPAIAISRRRRAKPSSPGGSTQRHPSAASGAVRHDARANSSSRRCAARSA